MRKLSWLLVVLGSAAMVNAREGDDFKVEPGYKPLLNGKNLDGWRTKNGKESLEGKTEAYKGRFKVADGKLIIDPKVKGDVVIETAKDLGPDLHIKFEFRPGKGCNNDLWFRGIKFDLVKSNVKNFKEGEWHLLEIISKGDMVEYKCNGAFQRRNKAKTAASPFGIRAEFGSVEIRRLRVKESS